VYTLQDQFDHLADIVRQTDSLLQEGGDQFWHRYLQRALIQIEANQLAGATSVLGCYGGVDTFSDFVLAPGLEEENPLVYRNLNNRLTHLRNQLFSAANNITSRQTW
jgi:hypothetical protein